MTAMEEWNGRACRTEIFGTLGPACSGTETLRAMFREGMTGIRLNLSHTSLAEAAPLIKLYREAAALERCKPQLLIDLQGPELRIGALQHPLMLTEGQQVLLLAHGQSLAPEISGEARAAALPVQKAVLEAIEAGDRILLDDGRIELQVQSLEPVCASVLRGGKLTGRKSLKIEGKYVHTPVLTETDLANLRDAVAAGVTAVMQPFVRGGEDLRILRKALRECGAGNLRIFAKIENMEGVRNIEEILPEADMIVIARGDLGNDMPLWKLPAVQKELSDICRDQGVPFLVVTQMLTSMIENAVPTRAEVSDIFHAVLDGASAVMVTNETAAGKHPVEAVRYLSGTCAEAEAFLRSKG